MEYKAKRDLPAFVREHKTFSPSKLREIVLKERNKAITPESITMWFKRNGEVYEELKTEVIEEMKPLEVVDPAIFENGTFEELKTVKNWIKEMRRRELSKVSMSPLISALKRICKGQYPRLGIDLTQHGWAYRHPDRLDLNDCIQQIDLFLEHYPKANMSGIRLPMRNFLESKGIVVGAKISGAKSKGAGKMANMFVEKAILYEMLEWIKSVNYEAYVCVKLMFKTATRITASLNALLDNLKVEPDGYVELRVFDKGRRSKYPHGHPWDKYIAPDLFKDICELTGYPERKTGKIFTICNQDMTKINRQAIEKFCGWIFEKYPNAKPNHFWRHMFAQHMLRKTGWNYAVVAALGGWTITSLEEDYGKPPRATLREWGLGHIPDL